MSEHNVASILGLYFTLPSKGAGLKAFCYSGSSLSPQKSQKFLDHLLVGEARMSAEALFQLGMDLGTPSTAQTEDYSNRGCFVSNDDRKDHFIVRNGVKCAGAHMIIDLYDAAELDNLDLMERTMRKCVEEAGATLLHIHLHHFQPNGGISGVAVLAESHISVHSWPEKGYAAFDVFMCGEARPELCVDILREAFSAKRTAVSEILRGQGA